MAWGSIAGFLRANVIQVPSVSGCRLERLFISHVLRMEIRMNTAEV